MAEGRQRFRYHRSTVAIWIMLGTLITVTSVLALSAGGVEALYLVVTGWIVGPFFVYWAYKKTRGMFKK